MCFLLFFRFCLFFFNYYTVTLYNKTSPLGHWTMSQFTSQATSANVLFPGHNHWYRWLDTLIMARSPARVMIKVSGHSYRWLWPGNRTFFRISEHGGYLVDSVFVAQCILPVIVFIMALDTMPWRGTFAIWLQHFVVSMWK